MTRLAVILCLMGGAAHANCAPPAVISERLEAGFGEARQALALTATGQMMEVYANLDTGTWTITLTSPNGVACIVSVGNAYVAIDQPLPGVPG